MTICRAVWVQGLPDSVLYKGQEAGVLCQVIIWPVSREALRPCSFADNRQHHGGKRCLVGLYCQHQVTLWGKLLEWCAISWQARFSCV